MELPVDLDEDLSRSGCGHIDLLNRSFGGLAVADFHGGLLLLGNVHCGHCCLSGRCLWADSRWEVLEVLKVL